MSVGEGQFMGLLSERRRGREDGAATATSEYVTQLATLCGGSSEEASARSSNGRWLLVKQQHTVSICIVLEIYQYKSVNNGSG